jgi:hypothetical protein
MSLDIRKSAGTITAQALNVSHQGLVVARQRKSDGRGRPSRAARH